MRSDLPTGTRPAEPKAGAGNRSPQAKGNVPGKARAGGQGKAGQGKPGQNKPGQNKPGQGKAAGRGKAGQGRGGPGKAGQAKAGQGKAGQGKTGQGKTGQGKAGHGGSAGKQAGLPTRRKRFRVLQGMEPLEPRPVIPDQSHLPPEQRSDLAVRVNDLYVNYRTSFEKKPTLRQALMRFGRGQRAVREVEALKGISFEVKTGTSMGIIGANGAGKSTLMRTMSGILSPTSGSVEVWGQASTLLALGVGFNNNLSGRENIILGGLAAGLSRDEVEDRANDIAEWTELGDFIDMPMRSYSSGMFSRVSFSVAVHMEPDILMIDEALSTGDAHFKEKASAKMAELRSKARAMFLVSHGLGSIKELCDEAIWIDKGTLMKWGTPDEVVDAYLDFMQAKRSATALEDL
ncbi:MAG TPA: ATP-binding cassette domain-containing protein [Microlunatus sp.]